MAADEKYVVFKRDEVQQWITEMENEYKTHMQDMFALRLEDAVVIRTQDVFAASGLSAYAHTIRAHVNLLEMLDFEAPELVDRLISIALYFEDCAMEARDRIARGDTKVPD